ncbi:unnamed protein product [Polarella glacialis]|uniref:RING-type domain-containing protein n=1 Tax=Polarella glacialis TaxID=89957 RepID=A0A813LIX5_POLGL|nr:unnamed protein product [Polarella glacialis]
MLLANAFLEPTSGLRRPGETSRTPFTAPHHQRVELSSMAGRGARSLDHRESAATPMLASPDPVHVPLQPLQLVSEVGDSQPGQSREGDAEARGHERWEVPQIARAAELGSDSYSSVEAALLLSQLNQEEEWSMSYIRDEDGGEGDAECRVCLVDYEPGDRVVRLPCMHFAHSRCMETWLVRVPRCPVCQTSLQEALQLSGTG